MEIFVTLKETLGKLWMFEVLKIRQKLDANMEGFRWASHNMTKYCIHIYVQIGWIKTLVLLADNVS